jgi:hypothetical protein
MNEARLRTILLVAAVYHLALGAFMFLAPGAFYDTLGKFPPRNDHYTKDVSTFYVALGVAFYVSVHRRSWRTPLLVFAALEYALHDFFALAAIALLLAALASVAWRVHPDEPAPTAAESTQVEP